MPLISMYWVLTLADLENLRTSTSTMKRMKNIAHIFLTNQNNVTTKYIWFHSLEEMDDFLFLFSFRSMLLFLLLKTSCHQEMESSFLRLQHMSSYIHTKRSHLPNVIWHITLNDERYYIQLGFFLLLLLVLVKHFNVREMKVDFPIDEQLTKNFLHFSFSFVLRRVWKMSIEEMAKCMRILVVIYESVVLINISVMLWPVTYLSEYTMRNKTSQAYLARMNFSSSQRLT